MPRVSIIVPLYNRKHLIGRCVSSVTAQDFHDWELIIVDDGSSDHPEQQLQPLCAADNRICYVQKENGGVSSARNAGIDRAAGEYLLFVDSDDELMPGALTALVEEADILHADLVAGGMATEGEPGAAVVPQRAVCACPAEAAAAALRLAQNGILMTPCAKLYRRSTVEELRFPRDVQTAEDLIFNLEFFRHCRTICLKDTLTYLVHPGTYNSLSASYNPRGRENLNVQMEAYQRFLTYAPSEDLARWMRASLRGCVLHHIRMLCLKSGLPRREKCAQLRQWHQDELCQELLREIQGSWVARLATSPWFHAWPELYRLVALKQSLSRILRR